jgi:hypothetical protein
MRETEKLTAAEIEKYVRENLYSKVDISWDTREERHLQIFDAEGKRREFLEPTCDAMLLMAKYYELKYGVKIIVVSSPEDLEAIQKLVDESEKAGMPCKFGFVLPNIKVEVDGFVSHARWDSSQPFSDLAGKLLYDEGHICPAIYEKLSDGRSSIITLDSIGMIGHISAGHRRIIDKIAGGNIPIFNNSIALQRSTRGCRDLGILMLKDALRMPNLVDELGLKGETSYSGHIGSINFDILPEQLLKFFQTGTPNKTAVREASVFGSSPEKLRSFGEYRDRNQGVIYLEKREINPSDSVAEYSIVESPENTKLLRENELMVQRIVELCKFCEVDSDDAIKNLIQKAADEKMQFPVIMPEVLPEWSRALQWKVVEDQPATNSDSVFAKASVVDKYHYQYLYFVAKNLQSTSQARRERSQDILDPFTSQVQNFCVEFIDEHLGKMMRVLCVMAKEITPELQEKFIEVINREFETNLVREDFDDQTFSKLKEALKTLDLSQENDPLKELIAKCNVFDDRQLELYERVVGINLVANLDKNLYRKIAKVDGVEADKLDEAEATDIVRVITRNMQMQYDSFENKREVRQAFRAVIKNGPVGGSYSKGLLEILDNYNIKHCLEMAYQLGHQEVLEMAWQGKIMPMEKLFFIAQEKGGLKNNEKFLDEHIRKDPDNFSKLAYAAIRAGDAGMIRKLAAYQKDHNFMADYDWNKIGVGESLPLIHQAATSYSVEVVDALLKIDGVDPSIKVGEPARDASEVLDCLHIWRIVSHMQELEDRKRVQDKAPLATNVEDSKLVTDTEELKDEKAAPVPDAQVIMDYWSSSLSRLESVDNNTSEENIVEKKPSVDNDLSPPSSSQPTAEEPATEKQAFEELTAEQPNIAGRSVVVPDLQIVCETPSSNPASNNKKTKSLRDIMFGCFNFSRK